MQATFITAPSLQSSFMWKDKGTQFVTVCALNNLDYQGVNSKLFCWSETSAATFIKSCPNQSRLMVAMLSLNNHLPFITVRQAPSSGSPTARSLHCSPMQSLKHCTLAGKMDWCDDLQMQAFTLMLSLFCFVFSTLTEHKRDGVSLEQLWVNSEMNCDLFIYLYLFSKSQRHMEYFFLVWSKMTRYCTKYV